MDLLSWTFGCNDYRDESPLLIDAEDESRSLSYKQIQSLVKQLIAGFAHEGISTGECVFVNAFNDIFYSALFLGIAGSGAIFTGVNPSYTPTELVHHMRLTKPSVIIVEPDLLDKTLQAVEVAGLPRKAIFVFDHSSKSSNTAIRSWTELLCHGEKNWKTGFNPDYTILQYASTSGTSGLPKAARLPHTHHVSQANNLLHIGRVPYEIRRLTALPPFHSFALPIVPASIRLGNPVYIMRRFDMDRFFLHVNDYGISETYLPPPVIIAMPRNPLCTAATMKTVRQIWYGGAMLKYSTCLPLYEVLDKDAKIQPVWGLTEAGWITSGRWDERLTDESVARPLEGFDIKVVDDNGENVTNKEIMGELVVKAPAPMLGYIDNPEATNEIFDEDGWVRTGDVGYFREGKVFVIDRKKDIIKVRGWQVSPAEIEAVLLQHAHVIDAAVVGFRLAGGLGEAAKAFIVLEPGTETTTEQIKDFAGQKLAKYKVPQEVAFVHSIPKNPTGKILRRVLRQSGKVNDGKHPH
jgi:acyl-coenzyme A synthetase/AMP-(fatty) acid ligase